MKIYTRTGDDGQTGLFLGRRVRKSDGRVSAYGDVDEANASLGVVHALAELPPAIARELPRIMSDLFDVGAELATPDDDEAREKLSGRLATGVDDARIAALEALIDDAERGLPPLKTFVLPGGSEAAARLHVARTTVRRAERTVVALVDEGARVRGEVLRYLNRLSDLLFVWARFANKEAGEVDVPWQAKKG